MVVFPNAKINLGLNVIEKRPDGYHNIETVMVPIGWSDILEIVPASGKTTTLTVTGNHVDCPTDKNLVMKAYYALSDIVELPPVDMYLHKVIPDGAGLGGGSSDASFTLKALNDMFALGFDDRQLAGIAAWLGADCPFFIYNRPMLASGTGADFTEIDLNLPELLIVVVKPAVSVSTKEAYSGVNPAPWPVSLAQLLVNMPSGTLDGRIINDFERSVFPRYPVIAGVKQLLSEKGALYVSMSGSGSSVYGLFRKGDIMTEGIADIFPGCDVYCGSVG